MTSSDDEQKNNGQRQFEMALIRWLRSGQARSQVLTEQVPENAKGEAPVGRVSGYRYTTKTWATRMIVALYVGFFGTFAWMWDAREARARDASGPRTAYAKVGGQSLVAVSSLLWASAEFSRRASRVPVMAEWRFAAACRAATATDAADLARSGQAYASSFPLRCRACDVIWVFSEAATPDTLRAAHELEIACFIGTPGAREFAQVDASIDQRPV